MPRIYKNDSLYFVTRCDWQLDNKRFIIIIIIIIIITKSCS